ncbi:MAG: hypothetical protein NTW21_31935 [Verrucomicrobia bacterium]|nr:hypothetical protein [Verrucomicrobiota bacterium]
MNHNPLRNGWFFPVEQVPIRETVTHNGVVRSVLVPHKMALVAADSGEIFRFNTMTDTASHPPVSSRFHRDRPILERRAGAWLRDFALAAAQPGFTIPAHLEELAKPTESSRGN